MISSGTSQKRSSGSFFSKIEAVFKSDYEFEVWFDQNAVLVLIDKGASVPSVEHKQDPIPLSSPHTSWIKSKILPGKIQCIHKDPSG